LDFFGTLVSDPEQMPSLVAMLRQELNRPCALERPVLSVGYYADDRALIIRKPGRLAAETSVYDLAKGVRSRTLMGCVASNGLDSDRLPPFRFRRWLFLPAGEQTCLSVDGVLRSRILDGLPDYIRTEVGANPSSAGVLYGMFLAELHREGITEDPLVDALKVGTVVRRTLDLVLRLIGEQTCPPTEGAMALLVSNGRSLVLANAGLPLMSKEQAGLDASAEGPPEPSQNDFNELLAALKRFRAVVIASRGDHEEAQPGWSPIPALATYAVDASLQVHRV
jgi:hypothetical protein